MPLDSEWKHEPVAVLTSGGLDSAILVGLAARTAPRVVPIYVRFGLRWEAVELEGLRRFLTALEAPAVEEPVVLSMPIQSVYGEHWSTTARCFPDGDSPDSAVFLPGRNLLLLSQTAVWCHLRGIPTLALATLAGNPFSDSTDEFFAAFQALFNQGIGGSLRIVRPCRHYSKAELLHLAAGLPIHETFSCIRPIAGLHCGRCNKCAERRRAFGAAGIPDDTRYAPLPHDRAMERDRCSV